MFNTQNKETLIAKKAKINKMNNKINQQECD